MWLLVEILMQLFSDAPDKSLSSLSPVSSSIKDRRHANESFSPWVPQSWRAGVGGRSKVG